MSNSLNNGMLGLWGNNAHLTKGHNTMDTDTKPRQSTTLWSWDTTLDAISVKLKNGHLEMNIGDITIIMSAKDCEALELVKKFGEVEVQDTTTTKIRV